MIPKWVTDGLTVAGGMLPVVGIAMLLHYMPIKKFIPYAIIGFVLAAYMNVPVLGIALVGGALGYIYFTREVGKQKNGTATAAVDTADTSNEKGDDYDE